MGTVQQILLYHSMLGMGWNCPTDPIVPVYASDGMGIVQQMPLFYSMLGMRWELFPALHPVQLGWDGMGWDYPHVPCCPSHPIVPFGMGWDYPRCTIPPTCSLLFIPFHCTVWDGMGWDYPRCTIPPTCSLLSIPFHCTIWDGMGWDGMGLSQVYHSPYMFPAVHPVPLYYLGCDGMGWNGMGWDYPMFPAVHPVPLYRLGWDGIIPGVPFPLHVPCCSSCPIVPCGMGSVYRDRHRLM